MWCEHPVSLGYITMRITIQELCVYNLVLETTTVISVDVFAVYICQLIDNIRTQIHIRQTLKIIWQYGQITGFEFVVND